MDIACEKHLELACDCLHEIKNDYIEREDNILQKNESKITFLQEHMYKQSSVIKETFENNAELQAKSRQLEAMLIREVECNKDLKNEMSKLKEMIGKFQDISDSNREGNYTGSLLWKITDVKKHFENAQSKKKISIYGPIFYSSRCGYKLQAQLFLNGIGSNTGRYASIFFHILPTEHDDVLSWPFKQKISFGLLEQGQGKKSENISFSLLPSEDEKQFERPTSAASEGKGFNKFFSTDLFHTDRYIRKDAMYIKIKLSNSK